MDTTLRHETSVSGAIPTSAVATATRRPRWNALDLFRFSAVVLMVQGHTFHVLVEPTIRSVTWYRWHNYVHGYTAPMFMFAAGLAFGITTFRRWDEHTHIGRPFWKRVERYLLIVAIGYLLHLPGFRVSGLTEATDAQIRNLLKVDALQVIGLTLLLCEVGVVLSRARKHYVTVCGVIAGALVLLAPWINEWSWDAYLPRFAAAYFSDKSGSIFPLAPWSGFILCGIVSAFFIQRRLDQHPAQRASSAVNPSQTLVWPLLLGAAVLLGGSLGLHQFDVHLYGEHNMWKTGPLWFVWRVGVILLFLAGLCQLDQRWGRYGGSPVLNRTIRVMGMETLVVYVVHLLVLYGTPLNEGLHRLWGQTLGVAEATGVFGALFAAMAAVAWAWHLLKTQRPQQFGVARLVLLGCVLVYAFALG